MKSVMMKSWASCTGLTSRILRSVALMRGLFHSQNPLIQSFNGCYLLSGVIACNMKGLYNLQCATLPVNKLKNKRL